MCTKSQLNNITNELVRIYRNIYGDAIIKVLLYGSYARNDQNEQSDLDMVAIVIGNRLELQQKLKYVWEESAEIGLENDIVVSPTVIPYDEFEKYKTTLPYYMNIEKEGIKVG